MANTQSYFKLYKIDDEIPEYHFSRFLLEVVDHFSQYIHFDSNRDKSEVNEYNPYDMIKLLLYGYFDNRKSTVEIADNARFNIIYRFVSNGIMPCNRTIRRFLSKYIGVFQFFVQITLLIAYELKITDFSNLACDGTILKAYNNKFNVMNETTIDRLIKHYECDSLTEDEISDLSYYSLKFLNRSDLEDYGKIEHLKYMKE